MKWKKGEKFSFVCKDWPKANPSSLHFSLPFLLLSLNHTQNPLLVILEPSSLPKKNVFLVNFLVCIDSALFSLAAMSAPLPRPSASAGDRRCRLPLSTSSSLPPLPPQSLPLSARCRYHRHRCSRCSVSAPPPAVVIDVAVAVAVAITIISDAALAFS